MAKILGVIGLSAMLGTWLIYPLVMALLYLVRRRSAPKVLGGTLAASVVIATRDEPRIVLRRIENLERYAAELAHLEIIVAVDRNCPIVLGHYRELLSSRAQVVAGDAPGGKAVTLNAGVRCATQDVVIFADSAQEFSADTLSGLVSTVRQDRVGAATGQYEARSNRRSILLRAFWAYETCLRRIEASTASLVGVTGAVYGVRRMLWKPLPAGLINDDLYVPYVVVQQGFRVVTCDSAIALDSRIFTPQQDFRRKVRTLTGILQLCKIQPQIITPFRNPVWLPFICHKLLRFATPYWLLFMLIGLLSVMDVRFIGGVLVAIILCVGLLAIAPPGSLPARVLRQGVWATAIVFAPLVATINAILGRWDVWGSAKSVADPAA